MEHHLADIQKARSNWKMKKLLPPTLFFESNESNKTNKKGNPKALMKIARDKIKKDVNVRTTKYIRLDI